MGKQGLGPRDEAEHPTERVTWFMGKVANSAYTYERRGKHRAVVIFMYSPVSVEVFLEDGKRCNQKKKNGINSVVAGKNAFESGFLHSRFCEELPK